MTLTKDQVDTALRAMVVKNINPNTVAEYFGVTVSVLWTDIEQAQLLGFDAWPKSSGTWSM